MKRPPRSLRSPPPKRQVSPSGRPFGYGCSLRSPAQLVAQIRYCKTELGAGYFPDQEDDLAAYLNMKYYHFQ